MNFLIFLVTAFLSLGLLLVGLIRQAWATVLIGGLIAILTGAILFYGGISIPEGGEQRVQSDVNTLDITAVPVNYPATTPEVALLAWVFSLGGLAGLLTAFSLMSKGSSSV